MPDDNWVFDGWKHCLIQLQNQSHLEAFFGQEFRQKAI